MRQMTIISGKGGTGKTVLTASFAALAKKAVLADCDVDAADLHLLLKPVSSQRHEFKSGKTAGIDRNLCQRCGKCADVCRFDAVRRDFTIDSVSCEGCAVCSYVCPVNAIAMEDNISGEWFVSETKYGPMVHAKLGVAEENSGKLVTVVRQNAKRLAEEQNIDRVIIDGPPGIGCPVIASLADVDLALIVTEPTLSGIHDMERVAGVTKHFGITAKVVVNKYDINLENTQKIKKICDDKGLEILAELPFSQDVVRALVKSVAVVEYSNGGITEKIKALWEDLLNTKAE